MKKIFLCMAAAAACLFSMAQPTGDGDAAEELKDKLYLQIMQAHNAQDWPQVEALMQQLLSAGANIDEFEIAYAQALAGQGKRDEAIGRLRAYLLTNASDYQAFQVLGEILADNGDSAGAMQAYEKCASIRPDFARPYMAMARLQVEAGDSTAAVDSFCKAIRLFLLAGRPDAAIQLGVEAMKHGPDNTRLLMLMGDALQQADMPDKALSFYAEVIAIANKSASPDVQAVVEADYSISMICYRQGQYGKALGFLQGLLTSGEGLMQSDSASYAAALCLAAACETRIGDSLAADQYLSRAKVVDPEGAESAYEGILSLSAQ